MAKMDMVIFAIKFHEFCAKIPAYTGKDRLHGSQNGACEDISNHIGLFFWMLQYKCSWYGKTFIQVEPKFTSQTGSVCGYISPENRKTQAHFRCMHCGHAENADTNAAKNILAKGLLTLPV